MKKTDKQNFIKMIIEKDCECKKIKDSLLYKNEEKTSQILFFFDKEKLSQFDLINLVSLKEKSVDVLIIICEDCSLNLNTKILKNLEIKIIDKDKLYNEYFLPQNLFPDCSDLHTEVAKKNFKDFIKKFFLPHKAKSFFLCGLVLIFSSIILPYQTYYLIFGSLFLIFSVVCKLQSFFKH